MLLPSRGKRTIADLRVVAAYVLGTVSGALLTALVAWVASGFGEPLGAVVRAGLLVAGAGWIWLVKAGPLAGRFQLPEARRQIPAEVFGGDLARGAYRFGFELGTGVRTYTSAAAPYVLLLVLLLARLGLGEALLIGAGWGLGRALPLIAALGNLRGAPAARAVLQAIDWMSPALAATLVLLGGLALVR